MKCFNLLDNKNYNLKDNKIIGSKSRFQKITCHIKIIRK